MAMPTMVKEVEVRARKRRRALSEIQRSLDHARFLVDPPLLRQCVAAYYRDDLPEAAAWLLDAKAGIEEALRELGREEATP